MKWKDSKTACNNKIIYKRLKSAQNSRDYFLEKYGTKQFIYRCRLNGFGVHYHLTTLDIQKDKI